MTIPSTVPSYQFAKANLTQEGEVLYFQLRRKLIFSVVYGIGAAFFLSETVLNSGFRLFLASFSLNKVWELDREITYNKNQKKGVNLSEAKDSIEVLLMTNILLSIQFIANSILKKSMFTAVFALLYVSNAYSSYNQFRSFDSQSHQYVNIVV